MMHKEQPNTLDHLAIMPSEAEGPAMLGSRRAFLKGILASVVAFSLPVSMVSEAHAQSPDVPALPPTVLSHISTFMHDS